MTRLKLRFFCAAASALAMANAASAQMAIPFSKHDLYFELNATDGDVGLHGILDADSWKVATIKGPGGTFNVLLAVPNQASPEFGMTELFFESNEPPLEDRSFAELITLFPPGTYSFVGTAAESNRPLFATDVLTTAMPCPPRVRTPQVVDGELVINWRPQKGSYDPDTGVCSTVNPVKLDRFEVVVEFTDEETEISRKFTVELPPSARTVEVPDEFLASVDPNTTEAKVEVLAIEKNSNRTAIEVEFEL